MLIIIIMRKSALCLMIVEKLGALKKLVADSNVAFCAFG